MEKKRYAVDTTFTYSGKWFVYAKNADEAREFVEGNKRIVKCWKYPSLSCTTLPDHVLEIDGRRFAIGWGFSMTHGFKDIVIDVVPSERVLPVMQRKPRGAKKCYEVAVVYERSGKFNVDATDEDMAREMVEKYCRQKNPVYCTSLPKEEVAWEFPRKDIKKTIGKITLV